MTSREEFAATPLPKRLRLIINLMIKGDTLCKTIIHTPAGNCIEEFHLEPSMVKVGQNMAFRAITSGFLADNADALIDSNHQTWRAIIDLVDA